MHLIRLNKLAVSSWAQKRSLLTLAIETSCDDTSVAVLEKHSNNSATLHSHSRVTCDNRKYQGVHPIAAHESHQKHLAILVNEALQSLPPPKSNDQDKVVWVNTKDGGELRQKPDFVTATRGPGMRASLITGIDTAKGLAVAWQVPFLGVNHMQAHALTPRMISAIEASQKSDKRAAATPSIPFLSLLVSGGNTMLVHSKGLCDHQILARTVDIAVGALIDKSARDILPAEVLSSSKTVSYGPALELFAFPDIVSPEMYGYSAPPAKVTTRSRKGVAKLVPPPCEVDWKLSAPFSPGASGGVNAVENSKKFSFVGLGSMAKKIVKLNPSMESSERQLLARELMRVAFEHLASRVLVALRDPRYGDSNALVVSGGVASNQFLKHLLRSILDANGFEALQLMFPPMRFCTDNAAMIAWTGIEMWEAGYRTDLDAMVLKEWPIDPESTQPFGILGANGWTRKDV